MSYHLNDFWIDGLRKDTSIGCDVIHQLIQRCSFYFLPFQVRHRVKKIKGYTTLTKFSYKQLFVFCWWHICKGIKKISKVRFQCSVVQ
jgi:hypothetical protein